MDLEGKALLQLNENKLALPRNAVKHLESYDILKAQRGKRGGSRKQRTIQTRVTNRADCKRTSTSFTSRCLSNLLNVPIAKVETLKTTNSLTCGLLNARSAKHKGKDSDRSAEICGLMLDNNIDVLVVSETWIRDNSIDSVTLHDLTPTGYKIFSRPRTTRRGGGLAMLLYTFFLIYICFY